MHARALAVAASRVRVLLRSDGSRDIGLGHVGRTLALAEELGRRLGVVPVLLAHPDPLLKRFLDGRPVRLRYVDGDGYALSDVVAAASRGDVLVTDTYALDEEVLDAVHGLQIRHLVVDDFSRFSTWHCDVVVNPNVGASPLPYGDAGRVLVGPKYALIRNEIRRAAAARNPRSDAERLLVCLGGGSWGRAAEALLVELAGLAAVGIAVRATTEEPVPAGIEAVSPWSLPQQLAWADAAIVSAGVVKYEGAVAGVPMLVVATVEHQRQVAQSFAATGAACYAGVLSELNPPALAEQASRLLADSVERDRLASSASSLIDGLGAQRAVDALLSYEAD